jgi:hypothetical protein
MNKTFSQKIARIFEIVGYLWLIPSIYMLFFALVLMLYSIAFLANGSVVGLVGILIGVIPFVIFGFGVFLLRKYYKHSRGLLDEEEILPLWFITLIFNLVFLLPAIYFYSVSPPVDFLDIDAAQYGTLLIGILTPFWWAAAVVLSGAAIVSEIKNQKYR